MNTGDIYKITSPSGKCYIGQTVQFLPSGKKNGYLARWKQHIYEAKKDKNYSIALDNALRKYDYKGFVIELLLSCDVADLSKWETYYIKECNTMHPNGYNLTEGGKNGRQSDATREKKRQSMYGKNKGRVLSKRERKNTEDSSLPKYVRRYQDKSGKEGYRVSNHPYLKDKSFLGKTKTMTEKLDLALTYLNTVEQVKGSTSRRQSGTYEDNTISEVS